MPSVDDLKKDYEGTTVLMSYTPVTSSTKPSKRVTNTVYIREVRDEVTAVVTDISTGAVLKARDWEIHKAFPQPGLHNTEDGKVLYLRRKQVKQWRKAMNRNNSSAIDLLTRHKVGLEVGPHCRAFYEGAYVSVGEALAKVSNSKAEARAFSKELAVARVRGVAVPVLYHLDSPIGWFEGGEAKIAPFAEHLKEIVAEYVVCEVRY